MPGGSLSERSARFPARGVAIAALAVAAPVFPPPQQPPPAAEAGPRAAGGPPRAPGGPPRPGGPQRSGTARPLPSGQPAAAIARPPAGRSVPSRRAGVIEREITLRDLGFDGNIDVKGIFPAVTFWFPVPRGPDTMWRDSYVLLRLRHSSRLLPRTSTVTVSINDERVRSRALDVAREAWFDIQVPLSDLRMPEDQEHLKVEVRFYNVISETPCEDLSNPALWASLHAESFLHLALRESGQAMGLSQLRDAYADRTSTGVLLVLPDAMDADQVTATTWLIAWLQSLLAAAQNDAQLVVTDGRRFAAEGGPGPFRHVVFLGTVKDLLTWLMDHPSIHQGYHEEFNRLFDRATALEDGDGLLTATGTREASRFFVTGKDPAGVRKAAGRLMDEYALLPGREEVIHDLAVPAPGPALPPPYQVSLRELGYSDQQAQGVATHVIGFNFKRADLGHNVREVTFTVSGAHSAFLDGKRSSMNIRFNQQPIKGVALTADNERIDALTVDLPPELMNPGTNTIDLVFDLRVADEECTRIWFDQAWSTVSASSYFEVRRVEKVPAEDLAFSYFPDPFLRDTAFLLPEQPVEEELRATALVLTALQRLGGGRFRPYLPVYTDWRRASSKARNLILIAGAAERVGDFARLIRTPLQTRGNAIELVDPSGVIVFSATTVEPLGILQLFPNPSVAGGAVLMLHATGSPRMAAEAAAVMADESRFKRVRGNVAILDSRFAVRDWDLGKKIRSRAAAGEATGLLRYRYWLLPPAIAVLALFLVFLYRKTRGIRLSRE